MNNDLKKAIRLLKQEINYAKTSESDSLTGVIARFNELETVVKNCSIPYVVCPKGKCSQCRNLPNGEVAISSKAITNPNWEE